MYRSNVLQRKLSALTTTLLLVGATFAPAMLTSPVVSAGQLTSRSITMSSSVTSATDVTYSVSFTAASSFTAKGIVIDFCDSATGPLIGNSCTAPTGFDVNEAGLVVANQKINGSNVGNALTLHANTDTNTVILSDSTGNAVSAGDVVTLDLGSSGGSDGITNQSGASCSNSNNCTFYARVLVYDTAATAQGYTSASPGAYNDYGGVALSNANQLTINARVQEVLQFCVGTTTVDDVATSTVAADCSAAFAGSCGTTVDLGILDSSAVNVSPVSTGTNGGNGCNGAAMVRTNAVNGVTVGYFAVQAAGTNHKGAMRVAGVTCNAGSVTNDQCINSKATQGTLAAGTENFGLTIPGVNCEATTAYSCAGTGTASAHLTRDTAYDGNHTNNSYVSEADRSVSGTSANQYKWDESGSSTVQLASSSTVVDDECLILKFAATTNLTTPAGSYGVTSTYIATATF